MASPGGADCSRLGGLTQEGTVISNMPLLFADGFPTCLDTMTESQLEKFIPFMIHCALGINPYENTGVDVPVWWPCTVRFKFPLRKPACFSTDGKWTKTLRSLVNRCYVHHECQFMLNFSDELVTTPTSLMKFVDLCDGTTELRDKRTSKLLVTFRNENRAYDKIPESPRRHMQLLPRTPRSEKPSLFTDIYLCESCDAEFETLKQVKNHEASCHSRNEKEEEDEGDAGTAGSFPETLDQQGRFLAQLGLATQVTLDAGVLVPGAALFGSSRSPKRPVAKRSRQGSLSFAKCTVVPISSPMGRALLRQHARPLFTVSTVLTERTERHCSKPFATKAAPCPRPSSTRGRRSRSPNNHRWVHWYSFSVAERRERYAAIDTGLDRRSRHLLARCKTLKIMLHKLTELEMARHARAGAAAAAAAVAARSCDDGHQSSAAVAATSTSQCRVSDGDIPVIDLCTSSDDEAASEQRRPESTPAAAAAGGECADREWRAPVPSVLMHQLTCSPRHNRAYHLGLPTDNNVHMKVEPVCTQKRVKSASSGPSENRVLGIPFLGRKTSAHKLFHLLEPDSKGKLKELNKIKKSNCVPPKVNWRIKCGESR